MGRFDPKKGIERLMAALAGIAQPRVQLDIYGRGDPAYEDELRGLAARQKLGERVVFHGLADEPRKARAFAQADVCVVPSHTENFGMVVAEALSHGVPVIASRGTPWAALEQEGCGLWVDNSPDQLRASILALMHRDLRDMGAKGRAWMQSEFSWRAIASRMNELYRRAAACKA